MVEPTGNFEQQLGLAVFAGGRQTDEGIPRIIAPCWVVRRLGQNKCAFRRLAIGVVAFKTIPLANFCPHFLFEIAIFRFATRGNLDNDWRRVFVSLSDSELR